MIFICLNYLIFHIIFAYNLPNKYAAYKLYISIHISVSTYDIIDTYFHG